MNKLTRKQIVEYILKIRLNFENAYPTRNDSEFDLLVESWYDILKKYPKEICDEGVNNALAKAKFAPRLGDITEEIKLILNAGDKTDEELWAELSDVKYTVYELSRYLQYPQHYAQTMKKLDEIFNGLSEELKTYLVNAYGLIEFSELDGERLPYEKNRFFKNIGPVRKRNEERLTAQAFLKSVDKKLIGQDDKK